MIAAKGKLHEEAVQKFSLACIISWKFLVKKFLILFGKFVDYMEKKWLQDEFHTFF